MSRRTVNNWKPIKGQPLTELDKKILYIQNKGHLVPTRKLIKTPEQIEGIGTKKKDYSSDNFRYNYKLPARNVASRQSSSP